MNLIKDNHKYMKREYYELEDIPSRKRKLQGLIKDRFLHFYTTDSKWSTKGMKEIQHFNKVTLPLLYEKFKSKDLNTRNFIKELLKSRDESNIIMAHEIIKSKNVNNEE
jgi:hypothetical protein